MRVQFLKAMTITSPLMRNYKQRSKNLIIPSQISRTALVFKFMKEWKTSQKRWLGLKLEFKMKRPLLPLLNQYSAFDMTEILFSRVETTCSRDFGKN